VLLAAGSPDQGEVEISTARTAVVAQAVRAQRAGYEAARGLDADRRRKALIWLAR
jgi:hypothetical protein